VKKSNTIEVEFSLLEKLTNGNLAL